MDGEGIPNGGAVFQELGQLAGELGVGMRCLQAEEFGRSFGAEAVAIPNLALGVFGLAKQRACAVGFDEQRRAGLFETSEVVKITVVAVEITGVAIARMLGRGGDDGNRIEAELGGDSCAALGVDGLVWDRVHSVIVRRYQLQCLKWAN